MCAGPESHMTIVFAGNVQAVGIGKALRVAVGRPHHRNHRVFALDALAAEFNIGGGNARGVLAWAFITQAVLPPRKESTTDPTASWLMTSGLRSSVSSPLPIRLVVVSWPPTMVTMRLAITSSSLKATAVHLCHEQMMDQPFSRVAPELPRWPRGSIPSSPAPTKHTRCAIGVVLKITQHFGEVG